MCGCIPIFVQRCGCSVGSRVLLCLLLRLPAKLRFTAGSAPLRAPAGCCCCCCRSGRLRAAAGAPSLLAAAGRTRQCARAAPAHACGGFPKQTSPARTFAATHMCCAFVDLFCTKLFSSSLVPCSNQAARPAHVFEAGGHPCGVTAASDERRCHPCVEIGSCIYDATRDLQGGWGKRGGDDARCYTGALHGKPTQLRHKQDGRWMGWRAGCSQPSSK